MDRLWNNDTIFVTKISQVLRDNILQKSSYAEANEMKIHDYMSSNLAVSQIKGVFL